MQTFSSGGSRIFEGGGGVVRLPRGSRHRRRRGRWVCERGVPLLTGCEVWGGTLISTLQQRVDISSSIHNNANNNKNKIHFNS